VESAPPDASTARSGRRAEGPASRWKPVRGRAPARVPRPRLWTFLGPAALGLFLGVTHVTDQGSGRWLAIAGFVLALTGAGLIRAQRRRYAAQCSLPPGDAAVVLLGVRTSRWKVWRRFELPGELVRAVGASLPQAWVVGWSAPQNLVVELDRSVAQAVASRLRAVGADVEVVEWTGDRTRP